MSQVYKADINGDGSTPTPQGFLDYEGVKHLWSKVSMKDYPNNETLAAVINAIDETKADKSELFSGSWNDLSDKPFFDNEDIICDGTMDISEYSYPDDSQTGSISLLKDIQKLEIGTLQAIIDGIEYTVTIGENNLSYDDNNIGPIYLEYDIYRQRLNLTSFSMNFPFSTLKLFSKEFKQLDSEFIGPDIARVSDIPVDTVTNSELHPIAKSGSWNDLEDKPFGKEAATTVILEPITLKAVVGDAGDISVKLDTQYLNKDVVNVGDIIEFVINGISVRYVVETVLGVTSSIGDCYVENGVEYSNRYSNGNYYATLMLNSSFNFELEEEFEFGINKITEVIKTIDESYIPDTIARVSDIITPVQSDWNENSSESISYIQNKPFYEETKYLLQRTIFNCSEIHSDYYPYYTDKNNFIYTALKVGKTYGINYLKDFGEYKDWSQIELIAQDAGGNIAIGNLSIMNNDNDNYEDTGEEFMILWLINHDYGIICTKEPKEIEIHEISTNELKQLDDKFISDNIARVEDIPKELTAEEAIALATETGLIDPIATTSDNTILTDVNNNIITL